jgi:hypothetical protein
MKIVWQRSTDGQAKSMEDHSPRFEACQPHSPVDNCWCLNIKRSAADEDPIKVLALPNPDAVEEFVKGWLNGLAHYSDSKLPVIIHHSARDPQTTRAAQMLPDSSESLRIRASTRVRSA